MHRRQRDLECSPSPHTAGVDPVSLASRVALTALSPTPPPGRWQVPGLTAVIGRQPDSVQDDHVVVQHGLRGGVEVTVQAGVGLGAAVVTDADHACHLAHQPGRLGPSAPWPPCTGGTRLWRRARSSLLRGPAQGDSPGEEGGGPGRGGERQDPVCFPDTPVCSQVVPRAARCLISQGNLG